MEPRPNPYDKTTHDGKTVDWLTKAALLKAERLLGYSLSITQGSYNPGGVGASAGTHDGGGVVDLKAWDSLNKTKALRLSGFWAWPRDPSEGPWPAHIHAVLDHNRKLSPAAFNQVLAGRNGRNGLANNEPDRWSALKFVPFTWPYAGLIGRVRWIRDQSRGAERRKLNREIDKLAREE